MSGWGAGKCKLVMKTNLDILIETSPVIWRMYATPHMRAQPYDNILLMHPPKSEPNKKNCMKPEVVLLHCVDVLGCKRLKGKQNLTFSAEI